MTDQHWRERAACRGLTAPFFEPGDDLVPPGLGVRRETAPDAATARSPGYLPDEKGRK